jgi:hypothetical protein
VERFFRRLGIFTEYLLVILFIVFEELIWERIAEPIYDYIHSLEILGRVEKFITVHVNRYLIVLVFISLFALVEGAGVIAGVMMVRGYILPGMAIYTLKIPMAAFTFWLFRISREKLLSFGWFAKMYDYTTAFMEMVKGLDVYKSTMESIKKGKENILFFIGRIKEEWMDGNGESFERLRRIYRFFKRKRGE